MQITRNSLDTGRGPSDWFTGDVYIDTITNPDGNWRIGAASVHFTPGARTAWHRHPNGQTIWVTEGVGLCQREGGPIEIIRPGDRVFFAPGENHWHGAAPTRFMAHTAMQQADEQGNVVTWGEHVTDDDYAARPALSRETAPGRTKVARPCKTRRRAAISDTREPAPLHANPHGSAPSSRSW